MLKKILSVCLVAVALVAVNLHAAPFRVPVTVNAGVGSYTISNVYNTVASGARVLSVFHAATTAPGTNTISYAIGGVTNAMATKAIVATDRTSLTTNIPVFFVGDKILFTSSDTNSHTVYITGDEF